MKTTHVTDYFAPLGSYGRYQELTANQGSLPPASLPALSSTALGGNKLLEFDRADRFTYIIMGLAVLIAIMVPLLNLN